MLYNKCTSCTDVTTYSSLSQLLFVSRILCSTLRVAYNVHHGTFAFFSMATFRNLPMFFRHSFLEFKFRLYTTLYSTHNIFLNYSFSIHRILNECHLYLLIVFACISFFRSLHSFTYNRSQALKVSYEFYIFSSNL